jgi:arginase
MGLAHALALPGCLDTLAGAFGRRPLLEADHVAWLGVEPAIATQWEREQPAGSLHVTTSQALAADPAATALTGLSQLPAGPLALHLEVDVLDFIDAPLAENTDCRDTAPYPRPGRRGAHSGGPGSADAGAVDRRAQPDALCRGP